MAQLVSRDTFPYGRHVGGPTVLSSVCIDEAVADALLHTFDQTTQHGDCQLLSNIEAAKRGEPRATDDVISECLPQVAAYLSRRGSIDADGLANTVMVEFLRNLPRLEFSSTRQMWSYINWISRSRLTDERRKAKPELLVTEMPEQPQPGFDEHIVDQIWVTSMLAELTEEQREILELRFLNDLSIEDTANRTGKSQTAVKGLQRRAINALVTAASIAAVVAAIVGSVILLSNASSKTAVSSDPAGVAPTGGERSQLNGDTDTRGSGQFGIPLDAEQDNLSEGRFLDRNSSASDGQRSSTSPDGEGTAGVTATTSPADATTILPTGPTSTTSSTATSTAGGGSTTSVAPQPPTTGIPLTVPPTTAVDPQEPEKVLYIGGPDSSVSHVCSPTDPAGLAATCEIGTVANPPSIESGLELPTVGSTVPGSTAPTLTVIGPADGATIYASSYVAPTCSAIVPSGRSVTCELATVQTGSTPHGRILSTVAVATANPGSASMLFNSTFTVLDSEPAECGGFRATIIGTSGADTIYGTAAADVIVAAGGDDHVFANGGDDVICLGSGDDVAEGSGGNDTIYGEGGNDSIYGDAAFDTLYGGPGDDFIRGKGGDDTIYGNEGDDDIDGGAGQNVIYDDNLRDGVRGEDGTDGPDGPIPPTPTSSIPTTTAPPTMPGNTPADT